MGKAKDLPKAWPSAHSRPLTTQLSVSDSEICFIHPVQEAGSSVSQSSSCAPASLEALRVSWGTSLPLTGLLFERGSDKDVSPKKGGALGAVKKKEMARGTI